MKILFKITLISYLILCCSFTLVKTSDIKSSYTLSTEIKDKIKEDTQGMEDVRIARYCVKLTSEILEFSVKNDIDKGLANCVGYAQYCRAICDYAYNVNDKTFKVSHVRGYVSGNTINLCNLLTKIVSDKYKNFVKDHDFIEIDFGNKIIYLDPSLYDIIGSDCMTIINKLHSKGATFFIIYS